MAKKKRRKGPKKQKRRSGKKPMDPVQQLASRWKLRFGRRTGWQRFPEAVGELRSVGLAPRAALDQAASWYSLAGSRPDMAALHALTEAARLHGDVVAGRLYAEALNRWYRGASGATLRVGLGLIAFQLVEVLPVEDPQLLSFMMAAERALRCPTDDPLERLTAAQVQMYLANLLDRTGHLDALERALALYESSTASLQGLANAGEPGAESLYSQALHNYACTLRGNPGPAPVEGLRKAADFAARALTIRERAGDLGGAHGTAVELIAVQRRLARFTDDRRERIQLIRAAVQRADQLLEGNGNLRSRAAPIALPLLRANCAVDLAEALLESGEIDQERRDAELETIALAVMPILEREATMAKPASVQAYLRYVAYGGHREADVEQLTGWLMDLASRFHPPDPSGVVTQPEAGALVAILSALQGLASTPKTWIGLGQAMGAVHPRHVGLPLARRLQDLELKLLGSINSPLVTGGDYDLREYVEQGLRGFELRLTDPTLSACHRRFYSAWIAGFSAQLIIWSEDAPTADAAERLRVHDLVGASAFRSESVFFGQGPTAEELPSSSDAGWRLDLFRARTELDHHEQHLADRELAERAFGEEFLRETDYPLAHFGPDGSVIPAPHEDPAVAADEVRREMVAYLDLGARRGWYPAEPPDVPLPIAEELRHWLTRDTERAVLVAGKGPTVALVFAKNGGITWHPLPFEDDKSRLEVFGEYAQARDGLADPAARRSAAAWKRLDAAIDQVGGVMLPTTTAIREASADHRISSLTVLARYPFDAVPWSALPLGDPDSEEETLGEVVAVHRVHSLAPPGARESEPRSGEFAYVGVRREADSALRAGWMALQLAGSVVSGPLTREAFETRAQEAGVLRLFAHGHYSLHPPESSGMVLDEQLERLPGLWQVTETRSIDLTGCQRVELWACQSAYAFDLAGQVFMHDEPVGIDTAFLLAGARRVVGSWWVQPTIPAAMIAAAFGEFSAGSTSAAEDARALARATRWYRTMLQEGGPFEVAALAALREVSAGERNVAAVRRRVLAAGLTACLARLGLAEEHALDSLDADMLAPVHEGSSQTLDQWRADPAGGIEALLELYRARWSWTGWRVIARDRDC